MAFETEKNNFALINKNNKQDDFDMLTSFFSKSEKLYYCEPNLIKSNIDIV